VTLGRREPVVLALDVGHPGPRRVTHLVRWPEVRRAIFPMKEVELLVVALLPGERPEGPPAAFRTPPGVGLLIGPGVWHHGPVAMGEATLLEALETTGPADRMDRRALRDLLGAEAVRVMVPGEPGAHPTT
jgi:ureidoglycolate hydrolase